MKYQDPTKLSALLKALLQEMGGDWRQDFGNFDEVVNSKPILFNIISGDVRFSIAHVQDSETSAMFLLQCFYGKIPQNKEEEVIAKLLELNFEISAGRAIAYGLDAETGEVVHSWCCTIEGMTGRMLYARMSTLADLAIAWREEFFLDDASTRAVSHSNT